MKQSENVLDQSVEILSPEKTGVARIDPSGKIIEMDKFFREIIAEAAIPENVPNLLELLRKNAREIKPETEKTVSEEKEKSFIYRWEFPDKENHRITRLLDFRICSSFSDPSGSFLLSVTDVTETWKKEVLLHLLVEISNAMFISHDLHELIEKIRTGLGKVMDTTNFYVALYDEETGTLKFPFFDDKKDHFESFPVKGTLTGYVIRTGRAQLLTTGDIEQLTRRGEVELIGTDSKVWMGAPLKADGKVFGVISVQNYENPKAFTGTDMKILELVASQIGLAIDRKRKSEDVVTERTYFEKLFHYAPVPIVIQKYPGVITNVNEAFENLFGYRSDEVIGKSIDEVVVPEEYRDEGKEITRKAFEGEWIEREVLRKRSDGSVFEVALQAKVFQINPGEKIVFAIYQDISHKKEYERKLVEAKEKAEEADRLKSAFLTNMSHEIRTPMNAILGFSQLLASSDIPVENKQEYTRIILESGENLLRLIDDILDLAKIESGQMDIRKEPVDVEEMLSSIQATFLELVEKKLKKELEIKLDIPKSVNALTLYTDPLRLKQIITNLIGNAVKFTPKGKIELGYVLRKNMGVVEFFVKDTGIGIPDDKLQLIFDRFQQVDNTRTRQYSGTGLGLAISKKLTQLLGGHIGVKSKEGKGSTFYFSIPLIQQDDEKKDTLDAGLTDDQPDFSAYKIMLAEDDEINFLFMRELLKKTGAQLIRVTNGKEVLKYIRKHKNTDLVLMDMEMPEMNGYDATVILKKEYPDIPVIAQTAYASPEEKNKCLEVGCDDYLAKPIQMHKLFTVISKHLKRK